MLSVLTLNLWHDAGPWPARRERIRSWIDRLDPDLIGFQEALRGDGLDQVAELLEGRRDALDFVHGSPIERDGRTLSFGNAIASRWPLVRREELRLADRGDGETRAALWVEVDSPHGPIGFTCTHLHWRFHHGAVRERQVRAVAEQAIARRPKGGFPPLVVGDFNAEPDSDEIRFLTGGHAIGGKSVYFHDAWRVVGDGGDGFTWSNQNPWARANLEPNRRIDYVFAGYPTREGVGLLELCQVVCNDEKDGIWPSDHFGVYAELRTDPLSAEPG